MTNERQVYPTYRFWLEIDQLTEAAFSECSGLQVETEIFEWEEGGLNEYRHRLPARSKYSNLVLKRGIAGIELWKWHHDVIRCDGKNVKALRRNLSVILYGYSGAPEVRWNIIGALPIKWLGPTFKNGASETAVETIELLHHGFERVK